VAADLGVALVPGTVVASVARDDVAAVPLAGRPISRRIEVALPVGGYVPRVTGALVDALVEAAAELDRPSPER
jgi:DNA-binding transcriptional LysR family regulator